MVREIEAAKKQHLNPFKAATGEGVSDDED